MYYRFMRKLAKNWLDCSIYHSELVYILIQSPLIRQCIIMRSPPADRLEATVPAQSGPSGKSSHDPYKDSDQLFT